MESTIKMKMTVVGLSQRSWYGVPLNVTAGEIGTREQQPEQTYYLAQLARDGQRLDEPHLGCEVPLSREQAQGMRIGEAFILELRRA